MLSLDLSDPLIWFKKGLALSNLNRNEEALAAYDRALALNPRSVGAWQNKAALLFNAKRWNEALEAYDAALAVEPKNVDIWVDKGLTLVNLAREEDALASYKRALSIDPSNQRALQNRDQLLRVPTSHRCRKCGAPVGQGVSECFECRQKGSLRGNLREKQLPGRRVKTLDGTLMLYQGRDLRSSVISRLPAEAEIQLGSRSEVDGREWLEARLPNGTGGYVLGASARSHTVSV